MNRALALCFLILGSLLLHGCGEPKSWQPLRKLGESWYFNEIHMGHPFEEYKALPFVLQEKTVLDEHRTLHHYTLEGDSLRFGPIQAEKIIYTFNHNNILKDIELTFDGHDQFVETRKALVALFGEPQSLSGRPVEEWYYNSVMVCLGWDHRQTPPGIFHISLLTPCKNY